VVALVGAVVALGARVAPVMPFAPELYFMVQFILTLLLVVYTCLRAFGTLVLSVVTVLVAVVKPLVLLALDYAATCRPVQFLASFVLTSDKVSIASAACSTLYSVVLVHCLPCLHKSAAVEHTFVCVSVWCLQRYTSS
jgi:hypothetical protein